MPPGTAAIMSGPWAVGMAAGGVAAADVVGGALGVGCSGAGLRGAAAGAGAGCADAGVAIADAASEKRRAVPKSERRRYAELWGEDAGRRPAASFTPAPEVRESA